MFQDRDCPDLQPPAGGQTGPQRLREEDGHRGEAAEVGVRLAFKFKREVVCSTVVNCVPHDQEVMGSNPFKSLFYLSLPLRCVSLNRKFKATEKSSLGYVSVLDF